MVISSVRLLNYRGRYTQAPTYDELLKRTKEAIELYLG